MEILYKNQEIKKIFIQTLIKSGKKNKAEVCLVKISQKIRNLNNTRFLYVLIKAIKKVKPTVGFKNVRIRGSSYKTPLFIVKRQQVKIGILWLCSSALHSKLNCTDAITKQLIQASNNQGALIKRRKEIYKLANQNKVFAHYRWS